MNKGKAGLVWCAGLFVVSILAGALDNYTDSNFGLVICIALFFAMNHDLNNRKD